VSYSFVIPTRRKHQRRIKNTATGLKIDETDPDPKMCLFAAW
jgi:hypothetical protein